MYIYIFDKYIHILYVNICVLMYWLFINLSISFDNIICLLICSE